MFLPVAVKILFISSLAAIIILGHLIEGGISNVQSGYNANSSTDGAVGRLR